ncbi:hypothetical protein DPEC_G00319020 [Dallia pectoralis]|uniref:Uncharacterized protein n=1 Tax=Dallia pectoralis TaxID=75939 RepID=A0ACC2F9K2_DALPE|nr:hypothetical protein DPEC_G00319020 [Dallia pectoralis]
MNTKHSSNMIKDWRSRRSILFSVLTADDGGGFNLFHFTTWVSNKTCATVGWNWAVFTEETRRDLFLSLSLSNLIYFQNGIVQHIVFPYKS